MSQPWVIVNKMCEVSSKSTKPVKRHGSDRDFGYMWLWPGSYIIGSRSLQTLWSLTTFMRSIISNYYVLEINLLYMRTHLDLGDKILYWTIKMKHHPSYQYKLVATSQYKLVSWTQVLDNALMTHPLVMNDNCGKLCSNPTPQWKSYGLDTDFGYMCTLNPWP